jgi:hypothetical protein
MEVRFKDRTVQVEGPGRDVLVSGRFVRIAEIHEEEWTADQVIGDPADYLAAIRKCGTRVDVFTFTQKLPQRELKPGYTVEWDNVAAIHTGEFDAWWNGLPQEARKNSRRAVKRGVTVREFKLDEQAVRGIMEIYNEVPMRQGRPFAHYGKPYERVAQELSSLPDRSEFIGAFHGEELVGFIKLVYMGDIASILHIVSKHSHYDKRPSNALVTFCAERCRDRGIAWLTYGKFQYGNKTDSPLTEFKRRNGFEKVDMPRYYAPLTTVGRVFTGLRLHRGLIGLLPAGVISALLATRARLVSGLWLPLTRLRASLKGTPPATRTGSDQTV